MPRKVTTGRLGCQTQQIHKPSETLGLATQPTPLQNAVLCNFFLHSTISALPAARRLVSLLFWMGIIPIQKNNLTKWKQFGSTIRVGRILESDVWPTAKAMCVPCSANKCRIRESDLQAACLYIIFLNGCKVWKRPSERKVSDGLFDCCGVCICLRSGCR